MKKQFITCATLILFAATGFVAGAQNNNDDAITAALKARRAAEESGQAAPATEAGATGAAADQTPAAATAVQAPVTSASAATADDSDPDETARKARIAAALKELSAAVKLPGSQISLQVITHRNIFNPNRVGYNPTEGGDIGGVGRAQETFYLDGIAEKMDKGYLAFFSGSGVPAYPPTRCVGDHINGFVIKDMTSSNVTMVSVGSMSGATTILEPLKGLARSDGGPWRPVFTSPTYPVMTASLQPSDPTLGMALLNAGMLPAPGDIPTPYVNPNSRYDTTATQAGNRRGARTQRGGGGQGGPGGGGGGGGNRRGRGGAGGGGGGGGGGATDFGAADGGESSSTGNGTQFVPVTTIDLNAPVNPAVAAGLAAQSVA